MKKKLVIITTVIILVFNFVTSLSVSAYTAASAFNTLTFYNYRDFSFNVDGCLILHSFFKTNVDTDSLLLSDRNLDLTFFSPGGTWQGSPISELSSDKICDQSDTVGFSQTVSYTSTGQYFLYSVVICLPCVAGDSFRLNIASSPYVSERFFYTSTSWLPGVSGLKKVYNQSSSFYTSDPVSFTTNSSNQFYICLFSSDKFVNSTDGIDLSFSDPVGSDYSNITRIASSYFASIYTSNFGLDKGVDLSLHLLNDSVTSWNFSVYEIFTDGTYIPGYDDGSSEDDSGGSAGSTDLSEVEKLLKEILAVLKESSQPIVDPKEFWAVYKSGLEEMFGIKSDSSSDPPPDESSETEDPTENDSDSPSFEIDESQFESAMDYVNTDDLGESISGPHGAIAFFWSLSNRFFETLDLYPIVALSLIFCLLTWLLRS